MAGTNIWRILGRCKSVLSYDFALYFVLLNHLIIYYTSVYYTIVYYVICTNAGIGGSK